MYGTILPSATNTYQLGDSTHRYTRGYINNLYADYLYPSANSCTIGTESNPYLCMYMTTTSAYSDYAVVNKAYLKSRLWGVAGGIHYTNNSQANMDTLVSSSSIPAGCFTVQSFLQLTTPAVGANNSVAFGWINEAKSWGYVIIFSFGSVIWGYRQNRSTFVWKTIATA